MQEDGLTRTNSAGNRTEKAHTEALETGGYTVTLRHYKYNQANQLILEWKEEGSLTKGTVAGEVWDEESGLAKLTLNGVTPSIWGDYFYGEAVPNNGTVFLLAEDHVKNQTLVAVNVTTGLSDFVGYSYDENGNLVEKMSSDGPVQYQWDHRNRLTKVIHPDGSETAYEYCAACPLGKLSKMTRTDGSTVEWVWDGISFLREVDSDDALPMEYFAGVSVKREGAWYYLHADVMGTVWQVTDENGAIVNDFQWDAWGNELTGTFTDGSVLCQIGWQGKRWDKEQGLYYSVARWYDQRLGRFTQVDPAEGDGVVSTGGDGYGWPRNSPSAILDPDGNIGSVPGQWMEAYADDLKELENSDHSVFIDFFSDLLLDVAFPAPGTSGTGVDLAWNVCRGWEATQANMHGDDHYIHCITACRMSRTNESSSRKTRPVGNNLQILVLGFGWEVVTQGARHGHHLSQWEWADMAADTEANITGMTCPMGASCWQCCCKYWNTTPLPPESRRCGGLTPAKSRGTD